MRPVSQYSTLKIPVVRCLYGRASRKAAEESCTINSPSTVCGEWCPLLGGCSSYLTLGQAEGVSQVQPAVHVGVREGHKVLVPAAGEDDKRAHRSTHYTVQ